MLIDTHCHINMMVKKTFDIPLTREEIAQAEKIIDQAKASGVTTIINVGTSLVESENCIWLAQEYPSVYATVGIHPNDCTPSWQDDVKRITQWVLNKQKNRIVGIGEIGLDRHYKDYNLPRQIDAFKAQIELALAHDLAIVIHSRDAYDETLKVLEQYMGDIKRAIMHCFSYDQNFAQAVVAHGFKLGIGGTITYPKNEELREIVKTFDLNTIVLETDSPFLPIQAMRGEENHPKYIKQIAEFISQLRGEEFELVATETSKSAQAVFGING